jgi:Zn-dependent peptidase ImmA (M78 family)
MSDHPVRRIFTMMHEMAHLMLRTGGLCTLTEVQDIEVFCNEVAGEALVPQTWLLDEPVVKTRGPRKEWDEGLISDLARRYRVSRETIIRRLLIANYATKEFYEKKREEYKIEYAALEKAIELKRQRDKEQGKESFGIAPSKLAVSESGRMFVRLVLESYRREKINTSEVADYLDVRTKHLDKIALLVEHPTLELGAA